MPRIEFIKDAEYTQANEDGTSKVIKIAKGTVMDVVEASAARWERRNVAKRVPSAIERASAAAPAPVTPPSPAPIVEAPVPLAPVMAPAAPIEPVAPLAPPPPPPPAVEAPKRQVGRPRTVRPGEGNE